MVPKLGKNWPDEEGQRDTSTASLGSFADRLAKARAR